MAILIGRWEVLTMPLADVLPEVVRVTQVHGDQIVQATDAVRGGLEADGIVASHTFIQPFMIHTADCLPMVIVTKTQACILHVSRKTLLVGLLDAVPHFIDISSIEGVWLGPHLCAEHFVFEWVGSDVAAFQARFRAACEEKEDGLHLSILSATKQYLTTWGVRAATIVRDSRCTFEDNSLASYRRSLLAAEKLSGGIATVVRSC